MQRTTIPRCFKTIGVTNMICTWTMRGFYAVSTWIPRMYVDFIVASMLRRVRTDRIRGGGEGQNNFQPIKARPHFSTGIPEDSAIRLICT
ncbi:hypothetical protein K438DRAFT_1871126 [Mycena galopus ATCC 62051]|nr:hypothetical protein K438DRAFT_1871126 [Mycena galopus ATCC 62051]